MPRAPLFFQSIVLSEGSAITVEAATPFVLPSYTASDSFDGDMTANVVVSGAVRKAVS